MKSTINNQFTTNKRNTIVVQNSTQTQYLFPDRSLRLKERIQQAEQYALNMQHSKLDWDKYKLNVRTKSKFKPNLVVDSIQNGAERQITQNSGVQVGTENVNVSTEAQTTENEFNFQFGIQQLKQLNQSSQNEFNSEPNNQHTNYQVYQINQFEYINAETNNETNDSQNLINDSKNSDQINKNKKEIDDFQISDLDPMQNKSVITPYQQASPSQSIKPKEKFDLSKVLDDMFFPQYFRLDTHKDQINSQNQHKSKINGQKAQNNTEILSQMLNDNFFPSRLHQQNNDMSKTPNQESDSFEMQEYKPNIQKTSTVTNIIQRDKQYGTVNSLNDVQFEQQDDLYKNFARDYQILIIKRFKRYLYKLQNNYELIPLRLQNIKAKANVQMLFNQEEMYDRIETLNFLYERKQQLKYKLSLYKQLPKLNNRKHWLQYNLNQLQKIRIIQQRPLIMRLLFTKSKQLFQLTVQLQYKLKLLNLKQNYHEQFQKELKIIEFRKRIQNKQQQLINSQDFKQHIQTLHVTELNCNITSVQDKLFYSATQLKIKIKNLKLTTQFKAKTILDTIQHIQDKVDNEQIILQKLHLQNQQNLIKQKSIQLQMLLNRNNLQKLYAKLVKRLNNRKQLISKLIE
ncbi:Hypothetical_protein [Hexamita inflata]|uniref:Hypothetical_protein n=1 Tax=Hexamita inflata TaxID=28002 RepID=A0AA86QY19_9EUKA|nr:Hypothetical protein HINF_LOCUS13221 [Hexamita inflata]CAI9966720.1 Hypothetical protein HINF_LOCUS54365 [Hexamita inflata]